MIFKLDKPSKPLTFIILSHQCHDKRLVISTKQKIEPSLWDQKNQKAKGRSGKAKDINEALKDTKSVFDVVLGTFQRKRINPSRNQLKEELNIALGRAKPKPEIKKVNLSEFLDAYILEKENGLNENGKKYSRTTKHKFKLLKRRLQEFTDFKKIKHELNFSDIDLMFYYNYVAWLRSFLTSQNTVGYQIASLKEVMRKSNKRGYHSNVAYLDFKKIEEDVEAIYLSNAEIQRISLLDFSKNERLLKVRDLFLLGCETGLRFSDFSKIKQHEIIKENDLYMISKRPQKSKNRIYAPLSDLALSIIKRYEFKLPKPISNQKMNDYIKEICELAGINETITLYTKGKTVTDEKFTFASTHTARRTFATNAYLGGVPTSLIMPITGHKTEKMFFKYIKVTALENAIRASQHPYFARKINTVQKMKLRKVD